MKITQMPAWLRQRLHRANATPGPIADSTAVKLSDRAVGWITCGSTLAALSLSYRNQFNFATQRGGYPVWGALLFPLMIDSFVIVGELRLFSAVARNEGWRIKAWAWMLTLGGLVASVAAGVAHLGLAAPEDMKLAAAVAPLAAAASLGTGLGLVKRRAKPNRSGAASRETTHTSSSRPHKAARSRARQPGLPVTAAELQQYADDQARGLPVGKEAYATRHDMTQHRARTIAVAAKAGSNGSGS